MATAGDLNLYANQRASFNQILIFKEVENPDCCDGYTPVDIRGWTAKMQIKPTRTAAAVVTLTETAAAEGQIKIQDAPDGVFEIQIPKETMSGLDKTEYQYDLFFTDPTGFAYKILKGVFYNDLAVTE